MRKHLVITLIYASAAVGYTILEHINPAWMITFFAKALPMIILFLWGITEKKTGNPLFYRLILTGIIFSLAGDLLLQWNNRQDGFFIFGLGAFLFTQVFYTLAFFSGGKTLYRLKKIWPALILLPVYGLTLVFYLKAGLGEMLIPVSVYASVIVLMCMGALSRLPLYPGKATLFVISGAVLFLMSDSMIAISRFGPGFPLSRLSILLTYFLGQYLIIHGVLARNKF
ncbi:MAG: lysoplasmalogenase [Bacteroidales bacterium]